MGMDGTWRQVEPYQSRYRYNGKELVLGLDWYAYGFRHYDAGVGRFMGVDPLAETHENIAWSSFVYVWNNPLKFIDPSGMHGESVDDDYIVNRKGIIVDIIKTSDPDRILTEDGGLLPFNDPENDPKELGNYKTGDQLVQFISDADLENIMTKVGAGKKEGNLVTNSFSKYDFAYSVLSRDYRNEYVIENNEGRRGERSKFIEVGGFYVFDEANKYNDPRRAYNIHDAGNFLWGQANKRDGHSLTKLLWGANGNEWLNLADYVHFDEKRPCWNYLIKA